MSQPFLGELRMFSYNFPPKGWAFCNGQILSIQQNAALFSLIGTYYGGNGVNTFALPNLQSRVPTHQNGTPGVLAGEEAVTLNVSQLPAHIHSTQGVSGGATAITPVNNALAAGGSSLYNSSPTSLVQLAAASVGSAGSGQAHENRQPFLVISVCIALVGVFPSRN
jgi:microcystin-dependent protein